MVGQHDHRMALQPGLEDALAGNVEVVVVDEDEHGEVHGNVDVNYCMHKHYIGGRPGREKLSYNYFDVFESV